VVLVLTTNGTNYTIRDFNEGVLMFRFALAVIGAGLLTLSPLRGHCDESLAKPQAAEAVEAPAKLKLAPNEMAIYVEDMHCAGCAKKLSGRLFKVKGVVKVRTDLKADLAIVTPQAKKQIDVKAAWAACQKAGFQPTKLIGPQGTFAADKKTKGPQKVAEAPEKEATKRS
jgi:copper chaperone CopZ